MKTTTILFTVLLAVSCGEKAENVNKNRLEKAATITLQDEGFSLAQKANYTVKCIKPQQQGVISRFETKACPRSNNTYQKLINYFRVSCGGASYEPCSKREGYLIHKPYSNESQTAVEEDNKVTCEPGEKREFKYNGLTEKEIDETIKDLTKPNKWVRCEITDKVNVEPWDGCVGFLCNEDVRENARQTATSGLTACSVTCKITNKGDEVVKKTHNTFDRYENGCEDDLSGFEEWFKDSHDDYELPFYVTRCERTSKAPE